MDKVYCYINVHGYRGELCILVGKSDQRIFDYIVYAISQRRYVHVLANEIQLC